MKWREFQADQDDPFMEWLSLQTASNTAAWLALTVSALTLLLARRDKRPRLKLRVDVKDPEHIRGRDFTKRMLVVIMNNPSDIGVHLISAHIPIGKKRLNLYQIPSVVPARGWETIFTTESGVRKAFSEAGISPTRIRIVVETAAGTIYRSGVVDLNNFS